MRRIAQRHTPALALKMVNECLLHLRLPHAVHGLTPEAEQTADADNAEGRDPFGSRPSSCLAQLQPLVLPQPSQT